MASLRGQRKHRNCTWRFYLPTAKPRISGAVRNIVTDAKSQQSLAVGPPLENRLTRVVVEDQHLIHTNGQHI